jgi:hypothetical protein
MSLLSRHYMIQYITIHNLNTSNTGSLFILPQAQQHLSKPLLTSPRSTTLCALSTQVDQLSNTFPARSASSSISSAIQELFFLTTRGRNVLFLLVVVRVVKVIDGLASLAQGAVALVGRDLVALLDCGGLLGAPFGDGG